MELRKNCFGVVIVAGSMHHLMSAMAYLESVKEKHSIISVSILCDKFLGRAFSPDVDVVRRLESKYGSINVLGFEKAISSPMSLISTGMDAFLYVTPRNFSLRLYFFWRSLLPKNTKIYWIDSEEGIGSYLSFRERAKSYLRSYRILALLKSSLNSLFGLIFVYKKLRCLTCDGDLDMGSNYLTKLKELYEYCYFNERFSAAYCFDKPVLIYVSQPVIEMGWLNSCDYHKFVRLMQEKTENMGYKFMIRPHPSERWDKYADDLVYKKGCTIEEIVLMDPSVKAISTICSTAVYTSKIINNLDVFIMVDNKLEKRFYGADNNLILLRKVANEFFVLDDSEA